MEKISNSNTTCQKDRISNKANSAEKAQSAVEKFCIENNIDIDDIKAMLDEHM